jgi:MFS family permease
MDLKRLFPILLIIFTNILGAGVIIPILPLYAEGQFAGTVPQITLLSALFFGAQFLAAPWLGSLSDRYGRRPVLLISQMGTVLSFVLFIFAAPLGEMIESLTPTLPVTGGMLMLFIARTLDGLTGGNITAAQAYVSDITSDERRAQGLGYLQGAFGVGFIFGPAFGGFLTTIGPVAPFIGAALITTGTFLLTLFTLKESLPEQERGQSRRRRSLIPCPNILRGEATLTLILGITFVATLAFSVLPATFSLYADRVLFSSRAAGQGAELYIGLMLTFHGLITVVTQVFLLRPLIERLRERWTLLIGSIALAIAFLGLGLAEAALVVTALLAPFAFGQGVSQPSIQSLLTRAAGDRSRGEMLGYCQSSRSLSLIIGPLWAGYVFEAVSARAVYQIGAAIMLAAVAMTTMLLRRKPAEKPDRR